MNQSYGIRKGLTTYWLFVPEKSALHRFKKEAHFRQVLSISIYLILHIPYF